MKISSLLLTTTVALAASLQGAYAQAPTEAERAQAMISMHNHYLMRKAQFDTDHARYDIAMLGDSITEGTDWGVLFPALLIANRGIGGDTTEGMLNRLDSVVGVAPRKVFLMAGINDIVIANRPVPEIFDRYRGIVETLRKARIQVVVQSTLLTGPAFAPSTNVAVRDLNSRLQAYCTSGACTYVDLNPILAPTGTLDLRYSTDHLHVNALGYQVWRAKIAPLLER